jgi:hypothetical protein
MDPSKVRALLEAVAAGSLTTDGAMDQLRDLPYEDLGFAKIDHHRAMRKGYPETIFGQGKTPAQVAEIFGRMRAKGGAVLATRCSDEAVAEVKRAHPDATHHADARAVSVVDTPAEPVPGLIAVVCAGTSDIPVGDEAAIVCELSGHTVDRIYDVGVAGIHRLFGQLERILKADVVIVCAGMEGALPSVVAGLVQAPVVAVPTSVGYGAHLGGMTALLGMLNSCATGLAVVNIDNGFGAGIFAMTVNRRIADAARGTAS